MADILTRAELLNRLNPMMHDPKFCEMLQQMSDAQLRVIADTLDDLSKWNPERRVEARKSVSRRVRVYPTDNAVFKPQEGLQEDISENGMGVYLNRQIPVGTRVRVRRDDRDSLGTIRQCRPEQGGWAVGILFDPPANVQSETPPKTMAASGSDPAQGW